MSEIYKLEALQEIVELLKEIKKNTAPVQKKARPVKQGTVKKTKPK